MSIIWQSLVRIQMNFSRDGLSARRSLVIATRWVGGAYQADHEDANGHMK